MEPKNNKATGSMKISEEVVATIVKSVLSEIEGVHSLATRPVAPSETVSYTHLDVYKRQDPGKAVPVHGRAGRVSAHDPHLLKTDGHSPPL